MKRVREEGEVDANLARLLMLLSCSAADAPRPTAKVFECKTCNRQFPSFQALGGHRASHKKPRLTDETAAVIPQKPRVHECSICGLEFALGQALGGHMRRHRSLLQSGAARQGRDGEDDDAARVETKNTVVGLDLNVPPAAENDPLLAFTLGLPLVQ